MKISLSTPVIVTVLAAVVIAVGAFFFKGATGEKTAPKPDPSRFLPEGVSPMKNP